LGPSRHLCCSGRRYTNAHAHCDRDCHGHRQPYCYSNRDRYGDSQPHCHCIGNGHAATDANPQARAISKAAPDACPKAVEFPYWNFLVIAARGKQFV
jgi:hypothetical protein